MLNEIIVILNDYPSEYYPIEAKFNLNGLWYQEVFEDDEDVNDYFRLLYPTRIIKYKDRRA